MKLSIPTKNACSQIIACIMKSFSSNLSYVDDMFLQSQQPVNNKQISQIFHSNSLNLLYNINLQISLSLLYNINIHISLLYNISLQISLNLLYNINLQISLSLLYNINLHMSLLYNISFQTSLRKQENYMSPHGQQI